MPKGVYQRKLSRKSLQEACEREFGEDSAGLIRILKRIATGEETVLENGRYGEPTIVSPTIDHRLHAIEIALAYQHGKPRQAVEVEHIEKPNKWDPTKLSLVDLETMYKLARKAEIPAALEGEYVEEDE